MERDRGGLWVWWGPALLAVVIVSAGALVAAGDVRGVLAKIHDTVSGLGAWGPAVFLAIFVVWVVLALPGSWLSAMAGVLFGTLHGFGLAMAGATLGAAACFLISRHLAREPVRRLAQRSRRFRRLERLMQERGAMVVIIVRLVPLFPYNITNYAFGVTPVGFWTYLLWSFVCMIPGTLFLAAGGDAAARAVAEGELPRGVAIVAVASLVVLVVLIAGAHRLMARREAALGAGG